MKFITALIASFGLSNAAFAVQPVDFSKSYVIPSASGIGNVTVGGINVVGANQTYTVQFGLQDDYSLHIVSGSVPTAPQELLEQKLRNTVWKGTYLINGTSYDQSVLNLNVVQQGVVAGEIKHASSKDSSTLDARVAGDIVSQYYLKDSNGNSNWYDADRIPANLLSSITSTTPTQYIMRLKRISAISYTVSAANTSWSYNREYRLTLDQHGALGGQVAVPPTDYGQSDSGDYGTLTLAKAN